MNMTNSNLPTEFVRRCHICQHTTIKENDPVENCDHCGKHFSPHLFSIDYNLEKTFTLNLSELNEKGLLAEYPPIYGLSLSW